MKKFIGDKKFYRLLFAIVMPIVLQQFITQFVSLLDNLMVGQVGSSEMTGVSLANQILFVFNLGIFGSLSGASIFATQYFGAKDKKGYQETFRFKWLLGLIIFAITTIIFIIFNKQLINFFINSQEGEFSDPNIVLESGRTYLLIMLIGNLPFIIKEIYATSLREMKETLIPMLSGILAIIVNLFLNYLLIFGKWGLPQLGTSGAAIATVVSRFVEMIFVIIYIKIKNNKFSYFNGVYKKILSFQSFKKFLPKTLLLLSNEVLWALSLTLILSCYALRGLDYVASFNICNTVTNVFLTVGTSLGNATAIILGNKLGAQDISDAKASSYRILAFSIIVTIAFSLIMIGSSFILPNIYETSENIKEVARNLIIIGAIFLPVHAFNTCCYFVLRAGGRIVLTILFDSVFVLIVRLPLAFLLSKYTVLSIYIVYAIVDGIDFLKTFVGYILIDKGIWLKAII